MEGMSKSLYSSLIKMLLGYVMSERKRACGGTLLPAAHRFCDSMTWQNCVIESFPLPTSSSVPTMARTMLRRKRSA